MKKTQHKNIEAFVGDAFFFPIIEEEIIQNLQKNDVDKIVIESSEQLDAQKLMLESAFFTFKYKMVILRNPKTEDINKMVKIMSRTIDTFCLIEIEADSYDQRIKVLKELAADDLIYHIGIPYLNKPEVLKMALDKMSKLLDCTLDGEVRGFLTEYTPKKITGDKPVHNLHKMFSEVKKAYLVDGSDITLETLQNTFGERQQYAVIYDITSSLADKDLKSAFNIIDLHVNDLNSAQYVMRLIMSELKIMSQLKDVPSNMSDKQIAEFLNQKYDYDFIDIDKKVGAFSMHPFRIKKILEKKGTDFFQRSEEYLSFCSIMADNLDKVYIENYKVPLFVVALHVCS